MNQEAAHNNTIRLPITLEANGEPSLTDPVLICPHCDYNLTGLPEDRCPECGEPFDRQRLIAWLTEPDQLPLVSMRSDEGVLRLVKFSLFQPSRLGRELAVKCDMGMMMGYGAATKMLACLIAVATATVIGGGRGGNFAIAMAMSIALTAMLCEMALAGLLRWLVVPKPPIPRNLRYRLWRSLTRCLGIFLPISASLLASGLGLAAGLSDLASMPSQWEGFFIAVTIFGGFGLSFVWWWNNLARAILARGLPSAGRVVVILLIPAVGIGAIFGGFAVTALFAALMNA